MKVENYSTGNDGEYSLYDSEKGKSSNERTENRKVCDITESESKL